MACGGSTPVANEEMSGKPHDDGSCLVIVLTTHVTSRTKRLTLIIVMMLATASCCCLRVCHVADLKVDSYFICAVAYQKRT
jgi:hypothetical protein